jgi:hypothetical protein
LLRGFLLFADLLEFLALPPISFFQLALLLLKALLCLGFKLAYPFFLFRASALYIRINGFLGYIDFRF